jgi:hypothetical protein
MKETLMAALIRSFVRKGITFISAVLLTKGLIDSDLANRLDTEAVTLITTGIISLGVTVWLSYKNVIIEFVKTRVALLMPPTASLDTVAQVAATVEDKRSVAKGEVKAEDIAKITGGKVE